MGRRIDEGETATSSPTGSAGYDRGPIGQHLQTGSSFGASTARSLGGIEITATFARPTFQHSVLRCGENDSFQIVQDSASTCRARDRCARRYLVRDICKVPEPDSCGGYFSHPPTLTGWGADRTR